MATTVAIAQLDEEVERSGIGHPRRRSEVQQRLGIDRHGQAAGFLVGHPAHSQTAVQLDERCCHPVEVLHRCVRNTVDVGGLTLRAVSPSCQATHEQILHAVSVERLEDLIRIEWVARLLSHET